ncbi:MAG: hypothetical protein ACRDA0_00690, partial [Cetobacterium sp.]
MTNQQIENIEDINEAINPITPHINGSEGLEILGHNRNQSVNLLRFSRSFFKIYSHLTGLYSSIKSLTNGKEDKIVKNDAFNKNFGTNKGEVLEGYRMAQIQGVENFGGDVQTPGVKKAGYSYWCTANKDFYVCKVENSLNYIDNNYFDAFSNAALLGKLQNLINSSGDIQGKIVFRQYSWSSPAGSTEKIIIPIEVNFKKVLSC